MIESLVLKNLSWIRGIARTFCRNRMDAEDLASETILKVLLNADKYDAGRSFRLWALVIMRNTFRSRVRNSGIVETFDKLPDGVHGGDPSTYAIVNECMNVVSECVKSSVGARSALLYAQGYSYNEIADMYGVTVNIVKSRIHHGRQLIMRMLSDQKVSKS